MEDRRTEERLLWGAKIRIDDVANKRVISADSRLRNIGKSGFGFVTEDHLTRGAAYRFTILLPTSQLELVARVAHFHIEATYYVCGAKIESLSLVQRSRINHFLASKSATLRRRFFILSLITGIVIAGALKFFLGAGTSAAIAIFLATSVAAFLLLPF